MTFKYQNTVSQEEFQKITELRTRQPDLVTEVARARKRRDKLTSTGYLNVVAADHQARGSVKVGSDPSAMARRHELLGRLTRILESEWVDGVLASMDVLEELLMIHSMKQEEEKNLLDDKILIASLNRGGIPGSAWELEDPLTGPDPEYCQALGLDATKVLWRMDKRNPDSLKTLVTVRDVVSRQSDYGLPLFLEPLPVTKKDGQYVVTPDPRLLREMISISSALGNSSRHIWLKLPYVKDFETVVAATTLPIVLLGGDRSATLRGLLTDLNEAMQTGHQVRGAMFGRNLLYPEQVDPKLLAETIGKLVRGNSTLDQAVQSVIHQSN